METLQQASKEMPHYKSHKIVWALKIAGLTFREDGGLDITPSDEGYGPFSVGKEYVPKHREGVPAIGWYFVQYENGYQSFSPADAFEKGYTPVLGATGQFPDGKLSESDEGELRFAVSKQDGQVFILFGKPVAWVAMPPETAKQLAGLLTHHAQ